MIKVALSNRFASRHSCCCLYAWCFHRWN